MTNMPFIDSIPGTCTKIDTFLQDKGYLCKQQDTTDTVRWRYYYKEFRSHSSRVLLRVILRFELSIYDSPDGTYDDNHYLSFNDAYISVYDRQTKLDDFPIDPQNIEDIERLCKLLQ